MSAPGSHAMRLLVLAALLGLAGTVAADDQPKALRVLCYNIHHGEGTDGKLDLGRIAGVIKDAKPEPGLPSGGGPEHDPHQQGGSDGRAVPHHGRGRQREG
jgi:hypothetical protein